MNCDADILKSIRMNAIALSRNGEMNDTSLFSHSRHTPSGYTSLLITPGEQQRILQEKKQAFLATIHTLFHKSLEKRSNSKMAKWKNVWKKHAMVRTAVWVVLAWGAAVAIASGAGALAAGLVATRTAMGAIGGYMAVEWLFDTLGPKFRKDHLANLLQKIETAESFEELGPEIDKAFSVIEHAHLDGEIAKAQENNKRFNSVKKTAAIVAFSVCALLGGSKIAEAAESTTKTVGGIVSEVSPGLRIPQNGGISVPFQTLDAPSHSEAFSLKLSSGTIDAIMADVLHDHPNQKCITLEQCIRRMEWLKLGISLDDSEKLKQLNHSVFQLTRDPNGYVVKAMQEVGCLKPGQSVDEVARKLQESDIKNILTKICENAPAGTPSISAASTESLSASTTGNSSNYWGYGLAGAAGIAGTAFGLHRLLRRKESEAVNNRGTAPIETKSAAPQNTESQGQNHGTVASTTTTHGPTTLEGEYREISPATDERASSTYQDSSSTTPAPEVHQKEEITQSDDMFSLATESREDAQLEQIQEEITALPREEKNYILHHLDRCPPGSIDRLARMNACAYAFERKFGFTAKKFDMNSEVFGNMMFDMKTIGGKYEVQFFQEKGGAIGIGFTWYDGDEIKYRNGKVFSKNALANMEKFSRELHDGIEDLFMEAIVSREKVKQQEFAQVHTYEISKSDLRKIYSQVENSPKTSMAGGMELESETGGFWMQGIYAMKDGILRFQNLNNPTNDEIESSWGEFNIKQDKIGQWYSRALSTCVNVSLSEQKVFDKLYSSNGGRFGTQFKTLDGQRMLLNWHKHPGDLSHPSGGDIQQVNTEAFRNCPTRSVWTWGIATVVNSIPPGTPPRNTMYLSKNDFGGRRNYKITFWKLPRGTRNLQEVAVQVVEN